jgi:hypothetical protein
MRELCPAGTVTASIHPLPLRRLLRSIVDEFELRASQKQLRFTYSLDGAIPDWIGTDPVRLRMALRAEIEKLDSTNPAYRIFCERLTRVAAEFRMGAIQTILQEALRKITAPRQIDRVSDKTTGQHAGRILAEYKGER